MGWEQPRASSAGCCWGTQWLTRRVVAGRGGGIRSGLLGREGAQPGGLRGQGRVRPAPPRRALETSSVSCRAGPSVDAPSTSRCRADTSSGVLAAPPQPAAADAGLGGGNRPWPGTGSGGDARQRGRLCSGCVSIGAGAWGCRASLVGSVNPNEPPRVQLPPLARRPSLCPTPPGSFPAQFSALAEVLPNIVQFSDSG